MIPSVSLRSRNGTWRRSGAAPLGGGGAATAGAAPVPGVRLVVCDEGERRLLWTETGARDRQAPSARTKLCSTFHSEVDT